MPVCSCNKPADPVSKSPRIVVLFWLKKIAVIEITYFGIRMLGTNFRQNLLPIWFRKMGSNLQHRERNKGFITMVVIEFK